MKKGYLINFILLFVFCLSNGQQRLINNLEPLKIKSLNLVNDNNQTLNFTDNDNFSILISNLKANQDLNSRSFKRDIDKNIGQLSNVIYRSYDPNQNFIRFRPKDLGKNIDYNIKQNDLGV
jgi:hypothetical protein